MFKKNKYTYIEKIRKIYRKHAKKNKNIPVAKKMKKGQES